VYKGASRLLDESFSLVKKMRRDIKAASKPLIMREAMKAKQLDKQGELFDEEYFGPIYDERLSKVCLDSLVETF
jgi:hypothetical protein